ncbi:glycosyltransferase [Nocardia puris]|uniref:glycosyltransferase n=1 Tax=Nocardia puris TaxID=208602 RepID=UPI0018954117|nr:glycosyltransferase [Nocardia puris]MBF6209728.1 glycosyltransferase [Nocardia puris]MBF6366300.1 glycosyltransferase [Nocardia puris]MBF6458361.1 glycosyltransferase [Nocardia puris]
MSAAVMLVNGVWSTWCAHAAVRGLRRLADQRESVRSEPGRVAAGSDIVVVVPMLHEADRAAECVDHWCKLLADHPELRLCVLTTDRERHERPEGPHSWDAVTAAASFRRATVAGRAELLHYPRVNRTYGEQLGWALDLLTTRPAPPDHLYVANIDSRLSPHGCAEIVELAATVAVAQQSSVFFGNLDDLGPVATAEAFYQSRWSFEHEIFRYLAGAGHLHCLPGWLRSIWYQHTVGHGLLIATATYRRLGGLPSPRHGLEDAALGVAIREAGLHIHPFSTLECGDAPSSVREVQRQRSTWIRGPLCSSEYPRTRRGHLIAAQGTYGGVKWALAVPAQAITLIVASPRQRVMAILGWLLALYGPLIAMLLGLRRLDFPSAYRPRRRHITRAILYYPVAAVSCWAGGLRGAALLARDVARGHAPIQPRTRETE